MNHDHVPGEVCDVHDEAPDTPVWVSVLGFFLLIGGVAFYAFINR